MKTPLMGRVGMKIRAVDGLEELGFYEAMSTPLFYFANPGDRLTLEDKDYEFNVATYSPKIDRRWIYTYSYAPDQSWTEYRHDLTDNGYSQYEYTFSEGVYFRVSIRKTEGGLFGGKEDINKILSFEQSALPPTQKKDWLETEIERITNKVNEIRVSGELAFVLLADTHYVVNGTFEDTITSIKAVHEGIGIDGIIHLGDLTDGMVTGDALKHYVKETLDGLKGCGVPVWITLGNHDSNYFNNNPESLSLKEQCGLYLGREEPRYYIDFEKQSLRLIFLDSFEQGEALKYGYSLKCIGWLARTLEQTPVHWRVIVFSHIPPLTRLQFWAKEIRGERELMAVLEAHACKILAFINGHNHADVLYNGSFPILSIANAKYEAFTELKPKWFVTPERHAGDASQELWDIMLVSPKESNVRFIRFGAGKDRLISDGRGEWL